MRWNWPTQQGWILAATTTTSSFSKPLGVSQLRQTQLHPLVYLHYKIGHNCFFHVCAIICWWVIQPSQIGGQRQSHSDFGFGVLKKKACFILIISKLCLLILANLIVTNLLFNLHPQSPFLVTINNPNSYILLFCITAISVFIFL